MSETFKKKFDVLILILAVLFVSTSTASASVTDACAAATPLDLDATYRGFADENTEFHLLNVPAAGIVALDVTVSSSANADPKLGFLGRGCSTAVDPDAATIEKSAARQIIAFRAAGQYYIRIAAQDPLQLLGDYKIHARFVASEIADEWVELDLGLARRTNFFINSAAKVDEQEVDPNPNGLSAEPVLSLVTLYESEPQSVDEQEVDPNPNGLANKVDEQEVDPNPNGLTGGGESNNVDEQEVDPNPNGLNSGGESNKVDEQEVDPNPNGLGGLRALDAIVMTHGQADAEGNFELPGLCRRTGDDHGDIGACSTPLSPGSTVNGQLANPWNDDADVFSVKITTPTTLLITSSGDTDVFGSLYNRLGQRLAADDNGSDGHNFRIVKRLDAGTYFLRVEGADRSEGAFGLTAEILDW